MIVHWYTQSKEKYLTCNWNCLLKSISLPIYQVNILHNSQPYIFIETNNFCFIQAQPWGGVRGTAVPGPGQLMGPPQVCSHQYVQQYSVSRKKHTQTTGRSSDSARRCEALQLQTALRVAELATVRLILCSLILFPLRVVQISTLRIASGQPGRQAGTC